MLSDAQLYVLAIIASIIVFVVSGFLKAKIQLHRGWLTAGVYVVSGVLAYAWSAPIFPILPAWGGELGMFVPALFGWFTALLTALGPVVALATLIYNVLLKRVMEGITERYFRGSKAIG